MNGFRPYTLQEGNDPPLVLSHKKDYEVGILELPLVSILSNSSDLALLIQHVTSDQLEHSYRSRTENRNKRDQILPGEGTPQEFLAFPWPWPFDPCSLLHSLMIPMVQVSHWPMFQPEIAAMPPFPVTKHLQLAGTIAASCRFPLTAAQLRAPTDSQEAAPITNSVKRQ